MRGRRTPSSNFVYRLPGGTEDNDLHVQLGRGYPTLDERDPCAGMPYIAAVFEPAPQERAAIARGANVELVVLGEGMPPVMLHVTDEQPTGRPQRTHDGPAIWAELPRTLVEDVLILLQALDGANPSGPEAADRFERLAALRTTLEGGLASLDQAQGQG